MSTRNIVSLGLCLMSLSLLSGCSRSSIDAKKTGNPPVAVKSVSSQLTEQDVFGNEATLNISEEDIQQAVNEDTFTVPVHSRVILVQSGNKAPEAGMQQEMSKYYSVSTFSGIPDRKKILTCTQENKDIANVENMNYMQALRYIGAKGKQKAIIVYWSDLEMGKYDADIKKVSWTEYKSDKYTGADMVLRYLVRFALVDVASGEWSTYSPANYEYTTTPVATGPGIAPRAADATELQIKQLKQKTYESMVQDLVNRYKYK
ncbi:hypothetical protein EL09_15325 [Salmonella enterica subsp. enterica]|nr:hypothetical protein [Salmonella enterica subsp. enterica]MIF51085.1 hypothetical protein [Salmonella enterica subsp. enterica]